MVNFIFALWIAVMPLVFSFSDLIGITEGLFGIRMEIPLQISMIALFYTFYLIFKNLFKFNYKEFGIKLKNLFKKPIFIIVFIMILSMILSTIINGGNSYTICYYSFFIIFYIIYSLNKNQIKKFLDVFLITITITCVMGMIDPTASFMPGFYGSGELVAYPLSNQFLNPNYTAYIVSAGLMLVIMNLKDAKTWQSYVKYGLMFVICGLYIFMNGSFSPITAVFVVLIVYFIYSWIKEKRFPLKTFIIFIILCSFAFVVDLIPNISAYRTCGYNYFLECIAVFDNIFDTNILSIFNIETIAGADGWDRGEFILNSLNALNPFAGNVLPFFMGYEAAYFSTLKPHLAYIGLCLDFGIITTLMYIAVLIYFFIKFFRSKKNVEITKIAFVFMIFIFNSFFGDIVQFWYWSFICVLAIGFKLIKLSETETDENK